LISVRIPAIHAGIPPGTGDKVANDGTEQRRIDDLIDAGTAMPALDHREDAAARREDATPSPRATGRWLAKR